MANTYWGGAVRTTGFLYGIISLAGGVAVFVLSVRLPSGLLYLLPPWLGRLVLNTLPWLVATGQGSWTGVLGPLLVSLVFVVYGLWALGSVLFGSADSLSAGIGGSGREDGD